MNFINLLIKLGIVGFASVILLDIYNIFIMKRQPFKLEENQIWINRKLYIAYQFTVYITLLIWCILSAYEEKFSQISPRFDDIKYISLFICATINLFKKYIMEKSISKIDGEGNLIPIEKKPFNKDIFVKIIILAALFALGIWNYFLPVVRFQLRALNMTAGILIMTLPLISMVYSFKLNNVFAKTISLMVFIPISLISVLFIFMTIGGIGLTLGEAYDSSFEQVKKIEADEFMISSYRSNGGATTSYGITVRQEKRIFPGVLLVKDIYKKYPKYDVNMKLSGNNLIIDEKSYIIKENVY